METGFYISNNPPHAMSAEEEQEIVAHYNPNDKAQFDYLVSRNIRLVLMAAYRFSGGNPDRDDLISEGTIGLMQGIRGYRLESGYRLSTFLYACISNQIKNYMMRRDKLRSNGIELYSYDEAIAGDDGTEREDSYFIFLKDDSIDFEGDLERQSILETIKAYLNRKTFTENEREIITKRYGLENGYCMTLQEIANSHKPRWTREYVRQVEGRVLRKLRPMVKAWKVV